MAPPSTTTTPPADRDPSPPPLSFPSPSAVSDHLPTANTQPQPPAPFPSPYPHSTPAPATNQAQEQGQERDGDGDDAVPSDTRRRHATRSGSPSPPPVPYKGASTSSTSTSATQRPLFRAGGALNEQGLAFRGHITSVVSSPGPGLPTTMTTPPPPSSSSASLAMATFYGIPLKYLSLLILTVQNSSLTLIMHHSRVSTPASSAYSAATAVLLSELFKGVLSLSMALWKIDKVESAREAGRGQTGRGDGDACEQDGRLPSWSALEDGDDTGRRKESVEADAYPMQSTNGAGYVALPQNHVHLSIGARFPTRRWVRRWRSRLRQLRSDVFSPDCWKLSIPALLYVVQNNLQYVAASNLDPSTFQVTYQMKILTTAAFSVLLLRRKLARDKWAALLLLAVGVGVVQIQSGKANAGAAAPAGQHAAQTEMRPLAGFLAIMIACTTSGLAGVYFEKTLKGSKTDLWVRNVQLCAFSVLPALLPVLAECVRPSTLFMSSSSSSSSHSLAAAIVRDVSSYRSTPTPPPSLLALFPTSPFRNFGFWAWATVLAQVAGGLVTSVVIKYSDNILKGFATSLSIVLSFLASVVLFHFPITAAFLVGTALTLAATLLYSRPSKGGGGGGGGALSDSLPSLKTTDRSLSVSLPAHGLVLDDGPFVPFAGVAATYDVVGDGGDAVPDGPGRATARRGGGDDAWIDMGMGGAETDGLDGASGVPRTRHRSTSSVAVTGPVSHAGAAVHARGSSSSSSSASSSSSSALLTLRS